MITFLKKLLRPRSPGLGWIPDKPSSKDWPFSAMGLKQRSLPKQVSLRSYVNQVLNQKSTSSCAAHPFASTVDILESRAGIPYKPVSVLFMYFNARAFRGTPVKDEGSSIRLMAKGLDKFGVPDSEYWPFTTKKSLVNRRPGWNPYSKAFHRRNGKYHHILSYGNNRLDDIMQALANGYPVVFGTQIANNFFDSYGARLVDKPRSSDKLVGGHAMLIVGYKHQGQYVLFEVLNSWGSNWRENGFVWLTDEYICWPKTRNFTVYHGWESLRKVV